MTNSRLVYSTEFGQICPECQKPVSECICKKIKPEAKLETKQDGVIRIRREVKGRKGKTVTVIYGFQFDQSNLKTLAKQLKQLCGTGGSVKDDIIIIQADHRDNLTKLLKTQGHKIKLSGG